MVCEDEEILQLIRNKDQNVFCRLYEAYAPVLYGLIIRETSDEVLASYILKSCFLTIWRNMDSFIASRVSLFTQILRIALQECNKVLDLSVTGEIYKLAKIRRNGK